MSHQSNKTEGIGLLILLIIVVSTIAEYLMAIVITIGIILVLLVLCWAIASILKRRKILKVRKSEVISVPSGTLFSIPIEVKKHDRETDKGKIKSRWIVMTLRPELDDSDLHFVQMNYELGKVTIPRSEPKQNANYQTTKQLSSLTKEIFLEINPQLSRLEKQDAELERLEKLVSSSEIYLSKAHLYKRAKVQVQQLIQQAEDLKHEYSKCIRELSTGQKLQGVAKLLMSQI